MPPERSVHPYAGEHRPTLRMPFAQLRDLVIEAASEAPVEIRIDRRPASDRFAEGTIDTGVDRDLYRLTVTATNDRSDCAFVVDSPAHPSAPAVSPALEAALASLDAIDGGVDAGLDARIDAGLAATEDAVDDFEAQPTAYRVRTAALEGQIATSPPR